jgi:cation transport ATPase
MDFTSVSRLDPIYIGDTCCFLGGVAIFCAGLGFAENTQPQYVHVDMIMVGDLLSVRPGEKVRVDGTVEGGEPSFDQSMVTGESMPVKKVKGNAVIGGTLSEDRPSVSKIT